MDRENELLASLAREFPGFAVIEKRNSALQRAIDVGLRCLTLGQMTAYLDGYQTTLGQRIYVTADWAARDPLERYVTLCHEAVHLRQFRRYGWLGMIALYLLLPIPVGLAWGRTRLEQEAYAETIRVAADVWGADVVRHPAFRAQIVGQFTGPSYGWMWLHRPSLERWYDRVLDSLGSKTASVLQRDPPAM